MGGRGGREGEGCRGGSLLEVALHLHQGEEGGRGREGGRRGRGDAGEAGFEDAMKLLTEWTAKEEI